MRSGVAQPNLPLLTIVEFVLGIIKIAAIIGFIIFGIVVNTGGVSSDDRGYIGFRYWNDSASGNIAFKNGE